MNSHQAVSSHKIVILGAGAIGQLIYHQLSAHQANLSLLTREGVDGRHALNFIDIDGKTSQRQAHFIASEAVQEAELLIVCVKAYQVETALCPLIDRLSPDCHILLLHNGMGPHLKIIPKLNGRGLTLGTTSQAALTISPWHVQQTGKGLTQLGHGAGTPLAKHLKDTLLSTIDNSQWCDPILPMLWQKLAVNIAINPLTAVHDCRNGELAKPEYRQQILALIAEVVAVAKAEQITMDRAALTQRVFDVIDLTANNYSSMHQDVSHQRETEIQAITGYLLQRAQQHQIATPYNRALYQALCERQAQYLPSS